MLTSFRQTPWPVLLLLASFMCPTELSLHLGSIRLPPHRALLLILVPFALAHGLGRRKVKIRAFDAAMVAFGVWTMLAYIFRHGAIEGLQPGGSMALDSVGSYLVARAYVLDQATFKATASVLFAAVAIAGALAVPEMLTGQFYVHALMAQLTGHVHPTGVETRLGLTRAFGTFDHPIHLGSFCAAGLALSVYTTGGIGSFVRGIVAALGAFTGLSSAPMLSVALQVGLLAAERVTRGIGGRVPIAVALAAGAFVTVAIISTRSPFAVIATGFTLDSGTGWYRLMIWENGLANVWAHPITGIGLDDWERPYWMVSSTVDAFWLVVTMRNGLPALLLVGTSIALIVHGVSMALRRADSETERYAKGWTISLIALVLVGCTVHYWNVPYAYFFFFLGLGPCLIDARYRRPVPSAKPAAQPRVRWMAPSPDLAGAAREAPAWADGPAWPIPILLPGTSVPHREQQAGSPAHGR